MVAGAAGAAYRSYDQGVVSVSAIPDLKTLTIPWGSMIIFFIAAGIFGVLAAILPARRAARLNILHAIQDE